MNKPYGRPASRPTFRILGPLEVRNAGVPVDPGPYKQRVLLAILLCHPNAVLQIEQLLDAVWHGDQPRTARKNLHVYISALRKITGDRIHHHQYGYVLQTVDAELDLLEFDGLVTAARTAWRAKED